jgi:hypothetical protein
MKTFKQYRQSLREKYINSRLKEWEAMINGYLPLNNSLYKDMEIFIPRAYRVTSYKGLKGEVKYQGQKKQIPCFTKGSYDLSVGLQSHTNFLLELEGKTVFQSSIDAHTEFDRNGKRWIDLSFYFRSLESLHKKLKKEVNNYFQQNYGISEVNVDFVEQNLNGKQKNDFIKWYYKNITKILDKKTMQNILSILAKENSRFDHNEVLLHEYQIKKVWQVESNIIKNIFAYEKFATEEEKDDVDYDRIILI